MERTSGLESAVRAWAERHGCAVRRLNGVHHWLFQKAGFMAEWWPNTAFAEASVAGRFFLNAVRIPGGKPTGEPNRCDLRPFRPKTPTGALPLVVLLMASPLYAGYFGLPGFQSLTRAPEPTQTHQ